MKLWLVRKAVTHDDGKLAYFKRKILEQLDELEEKNPSPIKKAFLMVSKGGKELPVGSIQEWKGKKYIKTPSGKWKPKYEAEDGKQLSKKDSGGEEPPNDGGGGISAEKQAEIRQKLDDLAVPMEKVEYSREEYNRLFPEGTVKTPIGTVKLGEGQFTKLDAKNRQELLGAVSQTLKDPVVILGEKRDGKEAQLYIKSFKEPDKDKTSHIQSVIVEIDGKNVSISTGPRKPKQIEAKIKTAGILLYLKGKEGGSPTHGTGSDTPVARQDKVSSETEEKSSDKKEKFRKEPKVVFRKKASKSSNLHGSPEGMKGNQNVKKGGVDKPPNDGGGGDDGGGNGSGKRPANLKDHIHTILHGTPEEKKKLQQSFFYMADTPEFMKDIGLSGDYFSVRFGVVSRHEGKDKDHNLTEQNWIDLTEAITRPFAIAKHRAGFRLFTDVKIDGKFIAVGVDVKNIDKDIEVNSVSTVFGKTPPTEGIKDVIYRDKKITPEQTALLEGPNSPSYPPDGAISTVSSETGEKSSDFAHNLKKSVQNVLSFLEKTQGMLIKQPVEVIRDGKRVTELRWTMQKAQKAEPAPAQFAVALDFDGVINSYKSGWKGAAETDEPVPGAAAGIRKLIDTGRTVAIYSTRANTPEGEQTIREYLRDMIGEAADTIHITDRKPIAAVYVDDRAIPFTGNWDETLDAIETFKPWIDHPPISNEIVPVPDGIYEGLRAAWEIRLDNGVSFPTTHGIKCSWNHPMLCKVNVISGVPYLLEKSLTWSGYKLQGRTKVQGMDISIENKKGSVRRGTDKDGHEWSTKMNYDYGYIRGTVGKDKDHLDCYLGPNPDSETVFVVHQNDPVTGEYDEDKVMLGFDSLEEARNAYLSQYDRPGFLGELDEMDIETFKEKAFDERNKGKKIGR